MQSAKDQLGSIDMLLCFAGVVSCLPSQDLKPQEWKKVLDVNLTGTWFCCQAAAAHMIPQRTPAAILLIASISAHRVNYPQPQLAYNVSKAALLTLKSCLAAEWAVHGIRVNSISPGYMDTILNEGEGLKEARGIWTERNPMGRMGGPGELGGAVVLLCSGAGGYMNGVDLVVDGGGLVF
jgi:sorbose reductase